MASYSKPGLRAVLAACLLAGALGSVAAQARETSYLFEIPLVPADASLHTADGVLQAELKVPDAQRGKAVLQGGGDLSIVEARGQSITIRVDSGQVLGGPPGAAHSQPSFVIDYREPAVVDALAALRQGSGDKPTSTQLTQFVADYIEAKVYEGGFDFASRVASSRRGDCTEHAVLLTALARATALPARVILGTVLVETEDRVAAYGHAWTEIHQQGRWQLFDATLPQQGPGVVAVRYLPLFALNNEGPGWSMDVMKIALVQPARITLQPTVGK